MPRSGPSQEDGAEPAAAHVVVKESASGRLSLSKIDPQKLHHGKRLHLAASTTGGDTQRTSLTALRRSGFGATTRAPWTRRRQVSVPREQLKRKVECVGPCRVRGGGDKKEGRHNVHGRAQVAPNLRIPHPKNRANANHL